VDRKLHRPGTGSPVKNRESSLCEVIAVAPQGGERWRGKEGRASEAQVRLRSLSLFLLAGCSWVSPTLHLGTVSKPTPGTTAK